VWKRGNYFTDFSAAASGKYYYRVRGVDLFGRLSPPAYSGIATVVDNVCPPAPIVTEARIFQTEDREILRLPLDERKHIRAVENHQNVRTVLRVRWQWPEKFRKLQDDLVGFRISMTSRGAPLNPVKDLLLLVDDSDGIPTLLSQADDGSCFDCIDNDGDGARDSDDPECKTSGELSERPPEVVYHYEIYHPIRLEAPVSELNAVETARYYDVRVQAFDRVDNASAVQRPWTVDIRDMTPPDRESKVTIRIPVPKPFEDMIGATPRPRKPSAPDPEGRSSLCLQWDARPNLSYLVYRLDQKRLCEAMIASGIPVYPSCMFLDGTEAYSEAVKRPELFEPVTPGAIGPFAGRLGTLTDFVPGVATNYFYYAVRAVDPAGNESQLSAPSVRITVSDRFAPAKPVIRRVTAVPGVGVTVEWAANAEETPDGDLDEYLLYRTDRLERSKSRNRMMLVQSFPYDHDPSKKVTTHSWTDGSLAAKSGGILYYRLEAIDTPGGNRSKLSEVASVKTVDAIPPTSAITSLNACQIPTTEKGANVTWGFTGTGLAADDQIRVLRRKKASGATPAGRWLALTGWLPIATKSYKDPGVDPAIGYEYGLEVRDVAGNTVGPTASTTAALVACGGAGATSGPGEEESTGSAQVVKFIRGDSNGSGTVDLSDAVLLLAYLYLGSGTIPCLDAADADGSGIVEMGDPYLVLGFLFLGTKSPPDPFPDCGAYAASALGCMTSLDCHR